MDEKPHSLSDADIASRRAVTRRTLLSTLGLGAGLAAVAAAGARAQNTETKPKQPPPKQPPPKRDPCRDADHGPPADGDGCGRPPIS
jgi:hypothetical protein